VSGSQERDFYFGKLRNIEVLCQDRDEEDSHLIKDIFGVLYATEEGFEVPVEDQVDDLTDAPAEILDDPNEEY
jgi:RP/EB family microtubule-associated protein